MDNFSAFSPNNSQLKNFFQCILFIIFLLCVHMCVGIGERLHVIVGVHEIAIISALLDSKKQLPFADLILAFYGVVFLICVHSVSLWASFMKLPPTSMIVLIFPMLTHKYFPTHT